MPTSTALTVRRDAPAAVAVAAPTAASRLDFGAMMQMAEVLVTTGFLPRAIQRPAQAVAIILAGQELGMQPMRALRSLVLVEGKVVEDAGSQLARFKAAGGRAHFAELTAERAELHLKHPNGDEHVEVFAIADARAAGLANKDVWKRYPTAMLRSRCITAGLKSLGWEGAVGAYDPEEAEAFRGVSRAPGAAVRSGLDVDDDEDLDLSDYAVVDELPAPPTLEEALEMPLPGAASAWGGHGGQKLAFLSPRLLAGVQKWLGAKLGEVGDGERPDLTRLLLGVELVLPLKQQAEADEKAKAVVAVPALDATTMTRAETADAVAAKQAEQRAPAPADDDLPF